MQRPADGSGAAASPGRLHTNNAGILNFAPSLQSIDTHRVIAVMEKAVERLELLRMMNFESPTESVAFVGDAVFALGCGRVFEGNPEMMWQSLTRLKGLPPETALYCAHEYTASNAKFAVTVDPQNAALAAYVNEITDKRARNAWTVPTQLSTELATNPFLRADDPALQAAMGHPGDAVATFAEIRGRKDRF